MSLKRRNMLQPGVCVWRHAYCFCVCKQDLIEVFKMLKGFSSVSLHELFTMDENIKGTRGHSCRLLKTRCTRDIVKYFFSTKVISRWNLLDQRTVDASSINIFKS